MTIWSQFRILGCFLGVCVSISLSGKLKIDGQHLVLDVTFYCFYIFSKELFTSQKQHFSINCYKELILFINIIHRYFIFFIRFHRWASPSDFPFNRFFHFCRNLNFFLSIGGKFLKDSRVSRLTLSL